MYMEINEAIGLHHSMAFTHAIHAVEPHAVIQTGLSSEFYIIVVKISVPSFQLLQLLKLIVLTSLVCLI